MWHISLIASRLKENQSNWLKTEKIKLLGYIMLVNASEFLARQTVCEDWSKTSSKMPRTMGILQTGIFWQTGRKTLITSTLATKLTEGFLLQYTGYTTTLKCNASDQQRCILCAPPPAPEWNAVFKIRQYNKRVTWRKSKRLYTLLGSPPYLGQQNAPPT